MTLSIKMNNPTTCVVCDNGVPTSEESPEVSFCAAGLHFDLCLQVQDNCVSRSQQQWYFDIGEPESNMECFSKPKF